MDPTSGKEELKIKTSFLKSPLYFSTYVRQVFYYLRSIFYTLFNVIRPTCIVLKLYFDDVKDRNIGFGSKEIDHLFWFWRVLRAYCKQGIQCDQRISRIACLCGWQLFFIVLGKCSSHFAFASDSQRVKSRNKGMHIKSWHIFDERLKLAVPENGAGIGCRKVQQSNPRWGTMTGISGKKKQL